MKGISGGIYRVKLLKLLTVPAVLLFCAVMAVPASAHALQNAAVTVGCGTGDHAGHVCVTLTGDIARGNEERFIFVDVHAQDATQSLGRISFDLPAFNADGNNHFSQMKCFPATTGSNATAFTLVVKVTSDARGHTPSDLSLQFATGESVDVTANNQPVTAAVDGTDKCPAPTPTPTRTPTRTATPTATPSANTTVALAQTGGFDFRFPLIGLTVLVAGLALFLVSASRGRRSTGSK
jgi:hypothetical protein